MDFGRVATRNLIELYGTKGAFKTPGSAFNTHFFSTYANNRELNHRKLLAELKPMRERLTSEEISSMDQILQRDLDDSRVANGLVPYIMNTIRGEGNNPDHIAFFPAILIVLMPKKYINVLDDSSISYPKSSISENDRDLKLYVGTNLVGEKVEMWNVKQFRDSDQITIPLGKLNIDLDQTDIVVIDGQHRANAFRVATGVFFENSENSIYEPFYEDLNIIQPEIDTRDLPVTIIWFEKEEIKNVDTTNVAIKPEIITRRLFIDVNNSARSISKSRQILLDDREPASFLTSAYYSHIAEEVGFKIEIDNPKLSLVHLGFDISEDLKQRSKPHCLTITRPEIIHSVIDWTYFAEQENKGLGIYYTKTNRKLLWDESVPSTYLKESSDKFKKVLDPESGYIKVIDEQADKECIKAEFKLKCYPVFESLLEEFCLLKYHYLATSHIEKQRHKQWTNFEKRSAWDTVFKGGQGLYYSLEKHFNDNNGSGKGKDLYVACLNIEEEFYNYRSELILTADSTISESAIRPAYNTFNTLAFQVGYFAAFYDYADRIEGFSSEDFSDPVKIKLASDSFVKLMNKKGEKFWIELLTGFKREFLNELDPRTWPAFKNLILRAIQKDGQIYFNAPNISPEAKLYRDRLENELRQFLNNNYGKEEQRHMSTDEFLKKHSQEFEKMDSAQFTFMTKIFKKYWNENESDLMKFNRSEIKSEVLLSFFKD